MSKGLVLMVFLIGFFITDCTNDTTTTTDSSRYTPPPRGSTPPELEAVANGIPIPVALGSYCWGMTCVDTVGPPHLLKDQVPPIVPPGSTIQFTFEEPLRPESVEAMRFVGELPDTIDLNADGTLTLPMQPGVYSYGISAAWQQGTATYGFHVEVE